MPTRDELRDEVLAKKAQPIARCLRTEDGQVLLTFLEDQVRILRRQMRPAPGAPVDPYQLARADGARAVVEELLAYRDAAERTNNGR